MSVGKQILIAAAAVLLWNSSQAEEPLPEWFAQSAIPAEWRYTVTFEPVDGITPYRLTPDIAFADANLLIRYRNVRSLSLLTFAKFRRSRLFFGVNGEGLVGLHFGAEQTVELGELLADL